MSGGIFDRPNPVLSASASSMRAFAECKRRYFWRTHWAWRGWEDDCSASRKLAYALKHSVSIAGLAGKIVHRAAAQAATLANHGFPLDEVDPEEWQAKFMDEIDRATGMTPDQASKSSPILSEVYYDMDAAIIEKKLKRASAKVGKCVAALLTNIHIKRIKYSPGSMLECEKLGKLQVGDTDVYVVPDLVYKYSGKVILVDWKTGAPRDGDAAQMGMYGMWLDDYLEDGEEGFLVLCYLADDFEAGEVLCRDHAQGERERIRVWLDDYAAQVVDGDLEQNAPIMEGDHWPQLPEVNIACQWCEFRRLCRR